MEEIDLRELFRYYVKRIPIMVLITLIALLFGYIYVEYMQVPMYYATTTIILVENSNEENNSVTQNSITINEKLVTTYSEIIKSRRVLDQVIAELDLNTSVNSLASQISVTSVSDTPIIQIYVYDISNKNAVVIANKVAEVFKKEITEIYNLENVSIIDEAIMNENAYPYNINKPKTILMFIVVGVVISFVVIFMMYYFDDTIKSKKEIEEKLGLAVLGEVPILEKLEKNSKKKRKKKKANNNITNSISNSEVYNDLFNDIDKNIEEDKKEEAEKTTIKNSNTNNKTYHKKYNHRRNYQAEKGGRQDERINSK